MRWCTSGGGSAKGDHPGGKFPGRDQPVAQTTLRSVLGKHELDEMLAEREKLNLDIQKLWICRPTRGGSRWHGRDQARGRQRIHDPCDCPPGEAERERRAKVIHAEGEQQASEKLLRRRRRWRRRRKRCNCATCRRSPTCRDKSSTIVFRCRGSHHSAARGDEEKTWVKGEG